jgi:hypothetical protein
MKSFFFAMIYIISPERAKLEDWKVDPLLRVSYPILLIYSYLSLPPSLNGLPLPGMYIGTLGRFKNRPEYLFSFQFTLNHKAANVRNFYYNSAYEPPPPTVVRKLHFGEKIQHLPTKWLDIFYWNFVQGSYLTCGLG